MTLADPVVSAVVLSALGMSLTFVVGSLGIVATMRGLIRGTVESALKESLGWVPEFRARIESDREQRRRTDDEIFSRLRAVEIEQARQKPR